MIVENRMEIAFFTASSAYDKPNWTSLKEATIYPTADLADKALKKLLKNGAYSAKLIEASSMEFEFPDNGPNKNQDPITQTDDELDDEKLDGVDLNSLGDEMTAGQLSGDPEEDLNIEDDDIEMGDEFDQPEDEFAPDEDEFGTDEQSIGPDDEFRGKEDNEQAISPIELKLMKGRRTRMPNGNGPVRESEYTKPLKNTLADIPLSTTKQRVKNPGQQGKRKLTDAEVRDMRTMAKKGISREAIYKKYDCCVEKSINDILNYKSRLSPACDIKEGIDTKVTKIKFKQDNRNDRDTNFSQDIEPLYKDLKVPKNVMRALKASIKLYDDAADFNNARDDSEASLALTIADALRTIQDCLSQGTQEGLKQAQIKITTFMNPITTNFPTEVIDYLYKAGRQPASLKNIFYDKWDSKPKEY